MWNKKKQEIEDLKNKIFSLQTALEWSGRNDKIYSDRAKNSTKALSFLFADQKEIFIPNGQSIRSFVYEEYHIHDKGKLVEGTRVTLSPSQTREF